MAGKKAARVTDRDSDGDRIVTGSPNVSTNNKKAARVTDRDSDGDRIVTGSPNVFIGG